MRFSQRLINPAPGSSIPGDFKPPVSLGVHDDLMTKVAYFNDGEKSALLVVADFAAAPTPIRAAWCWASRPSPTPKPTWNM